MRFTRKLWRLNQPLIVSYKKTSRKVPLCWVRVAMQSFWTRSFHFSSKIYRRRHWNRGWMKMLWYPRRMRKTKRFLNTWRILSPRATRALGPNQLWLGYQAPLKCQILWSSTLILQASTQLWDPVSTARETDLQIRRAVSLTLLSLKMFSNSVKMRWKRSSRSKILCKNRLMDSNLKSMKSKGN